MALGTSYQESDIAYEDGPYFALKVPHGFNIYKSGITHATRCAIIGYKGEEGLAKVKAEIERRKRKESSE